jgi:TRAP-type mannitol/chloroaromatic compound transport system substrate-binding protein
MSRLGVTVQVIPGGEIFQALDTGAVDAAEWVGPYDDLQLGFQDAAQFYYYPGWWEPGPTLEVQMSLQEWEQLPSIYQEIVQTAAHQANQTMMARYDVRNPQALQEIVDSGTELRQYPQDVLDAGRTAAFELYDEFASSDPAFGEIFEGWNAFRQQIEPWFALAELATIQNAADNAEDS